MIFSGFTTSPQNASVASCSKRAAWVSRGNPSRLPLPGAVPKMFGDRVELAALTPKPTNLGQRSRNVRERELVRPRVGQIEVPAGPDTDCVVLVHPMAIQPRT
jgi:hypothetical protein